MRRNKICQSFLLFLLFTFSLPCVHAQDLNSLLYTIHHAKGDTLQILAYKKLVKYYEKDNVDTAVFYAEQGLQTAVSKKDLCGEAQMIELLGKIDQSHGRLEIAKQRTLYALKLYTETGNRKGVAGVNNSLGAIEATLGNSGAAIGYFITALKIYDTLNTDYEGAMLTNMNLGCLYLQNGDTTTAGKYLFKSEEISKKLRVIDATISLYNYIGVMYAIKGNMSKALEYFLNDVKISEQPEFVASHVESMLYLGNFYNDMGDTKNAMEYLNKGLAIAVEKKLAESQADILLQLAVMSKKADPSRAMAYLKEALAICESMSSKTLKSDIYKEMSSVYERQGKYKEALEVTRLQHIIADSIFRVNKIKELASLGATYELEKSNNRIKELEYLSKRSRASEI